MMSWWRERSERERLLLSAAGVVAGLVALFQFAVVPMTSFLSSADARLARSAATYSVVAESAARAARNAERSVATADTPLRSAVTSSARRYGLEIARISAPEDGAVDVSVTNAPSTDLFRWISALEAEYGVIVGRAVVNKNADGETVTAQFTLSKAGA